MNKLQVTIFILIVIVFGVLFFTIQKSNSAKSSLLSPTPDPLPTGSEYLRVISPAPQQGVEGAQQQQQQQQPGAQTPQGTSSLYEGPLQERMPITLKTTKGDIKIDLYGSDTPNTVRNFLGKAQSGFYTNLTFHRVEDWVVQGGDPTGTGTGGGKITSELNDKPFTTGAVGLARTPASKEISNDSQFFIVKTDASHLNNEYVNFGMVTDGMDVVNAMAIGDRIIGITFGQ